MWLKLFFLLLYFLVLFVLARFFEAIVWYETGIFATQLVDPVALSFKKLKTILECRGLGYSGLPEKKDVRELVEKSGDLMEGELYSALKEEEASESVSSTNFSGEMHFYELVEDTKDGIWLVQVIANDRSPLVGKIHWEKMVKKVSRFGIRTGTFNCSSDPRYCRRRGWLRSTLIMSVPQTSTSKGKVMLKEYSGRKIEVEHIFKWITAHAASRIKTIYNAEHLKEEWNKSDQYWVKIYLFANLDQPPAFFSALSIKFTGRVEFIFVNVENWDNKSFMTDIGVYNMPSYILRTPEGIYRYGNHTGEFISLQAMDSFLRSLQPEVNDLFVLSLVLVNLMAWMDLFITQGATIKRFVVLISTLGTYNSLLIISWLPVLGFLQLPYLDSFYEYSLKLLRYSNTTTLASWVRADWMFYSSHPALFLSTYLGHGLLIDYFEKKRRRNSNNDEVNANNLEWLSSLWDWYTSYLFHPIASFQNFPIESDWDEDPDLFLERLAFPDLWLHPLIPTDYIKNLPMWRFKCLGVQSEEEMSEGSQDIENDSDSESTDTFSSEKEVFEDKESIVHNSPGRASHCDAEACSCANKYCQTSPYEKKGRSYGLYNANEDMEPDWLTWPADMLHCTECVVCLENFENGCLLMGLPCGHVFHQNCIVMWLAGGRHCCPVCRWPSYKKKQPYAQHQPLSNDVPS
ncbi:E3 ubiquitin-protein ligase RNF103 isoform X1 [Herpailurus yagouaroundi]|uniref:RING-type domain-containing protein n=3 Tax=Felinae TaxID=338152 RepID=A0ABI7W1L5_FELCA|nr:E3 ubiquitin-protein ligase RNF103 isoform X1 [Felis catus]XP_014931263.1 E3 ubiquitin-protein ligase RNF103 isoform X1 [Acinonyx jubatus]XP_040352772.1 E3 ubiquitin-protein ligase RNF103 isoform X1 [Puma yagouaroundi]